MWAQLQYEKGPVVGHRHELRAGPGTRLGCLHPPLLETLIEGLEGGVFDRSLVEGRDEAGQQLSVVLDAARYCRDHCRGERIEESRSRGRWRKL